MINYLLTLECDWEKELRAAHDIKLARYTTGINRINFMAARRTLNARIKELNGMIANGTAYVRDRKEN